MPVVRAETEGRESRIICGVKVCGSDDAWSAECSEVESDRTGSWDAGAGSGNLRERRNPKAETVRPQANPTAEKSRSRAGSACTMGTDKNTG